MDFKPSNLPCYEGGKAFENETYRVVFYEVSTSNHMTRPCKHWRAYHLPNGAYIGDGNTEYKSKDEAIKACENHYEQQLKK